jgi:hypothetical protein
MGTPLLSPAVPSTPVDQITDADAFTAMMAENRRREAYAFSLDIVTSVKHRFDGIRAGLYEDILGPLFAYQRTAFISLQYYQITGKVYNGNDSQKIRLAKDPNDTIPKGARLPALVQLPTAAGKTWVIGAAAIGRKTLVVVPNGGIRGGYLDALTSQYDAMHVDVGFLILDPTARKKLTTPGGKVVRFVNPDSAQLQNECQLFVTTYQALTDPEVLTRLFATFGKNSPIEQVIFDEGHHAAASTYRHITKTAYAAHPDVHIVYFTALLDRLDEQFIRHVRVYSMPLRWARTAGICADIRVNYIDFHFDEIRWFTEGCDAVRVEKVRRKKRKAVKEPEIAKLSDEDDFSVDDIARAQRESIMQYEADGIGSSGGSSSGSGSGPNYHAGPSRLVTGDSMDIDADGSADVPEGGSDDLLHDLSASDYLPGDLSNDSDDDYEISSESSHDSDSQPDTDDDEEEEVDGARMSDQQRRIAQLVPENEGVQKHLIRQTLWCLVNRAKRTGTYIASMFACRDQEHARQVRIWIDEVIEEEFTSKDENWKHILRAELIITKTAPGLPITSESYPGMAPGANENVRQGRSNIVVQVFMYSEGVDVVPIKIITFLCPRSKHIAYQMLGRGLRVFRFNDPRHNGRWFNPDAAQTSGMMHWSSCFRSKTNEIGSQYDLIFDNILDVFVPECFDMRKDFESLDDTIYCPQKDPAPEGIIISGGTRTEKKRKTQMVELGYSGVDKDVRDMKGKAVAGISTVAAPVDLNTDFITSQLNLLAERGLDTGTAEMNGNDRIDMLLRGVMRLGEALKVSS